jgi:acyl-coenzyme A synthetase/AMP-(fatty) acid ligase
MKVEGETFDKVIISGKKIAKSPVHNIAEMIFHSLPHRKEPCCVLMGHDEDRIIKISLEKFRGIIAHLYQVFEEKNIQPGDTVFLASVSVNNEVFIALLFSALVSYGCRVFLPMFIETKELDYWIEMVQYTSIIIPEEEISSSNNLKAKRIIQEIRRIAVQHKMNVFDVENDFHLRDLVFKDIPLKQPLTKNEIVHRIMKDTQVDTDAAIFTTSGTAGKSKLVLYDQSGFINSCTSWQESGLFETEKMGGTSLIDIFCHTISVRALFNAIWTGLPVAMMRSHWVKKQPQKILPFLTEMKPQVITMGISSLRLIVEFIKVAPELKTLVFSDVHTIVSTGARYSVEVAEDLKSMFGLPLHDAYGTSETQQVLTTVLYEEINENNRGSLGSPLNGVEIGLVTFYDDFFKLYVKSPFGHKAILGEDAEYAEGFYYTGDIVKFHNNHLFYVGRERKDFFKNGYGAKVPISIIENNYAELYKRSKHIEFFASESLNLSLGFSALIFIKNSTIPKGRVTNNRVIHEYYNLIKTINKNLANTLEPFAYEQRTITRFLLINDEAFMTFKGTSSRSQIEAHYENEIVDLLHAQKRTSGVRVIHTPENRLLFLLLRSHFLKYTFIRKVLLKICLLSGKKQGDNIA